MWQRDTRSFASESDYFYNSSDIYFRKLHYMTWLNKNKPPVPYELTSVEYYTAVEWFVSSGLILRRNKIAHTWPLHVAQLVQHRIISVSPGLWKIDNTTKVKISNSYILEQTELKIDPQAASRRAMQEHVQKTIERTIYGV